MTIALTSGQLDRANARPRALESLGEFADPEDRRLVELFLRTKAELTQIAYAPSIARYFRDTKKPLRTQGLEDVLLFKDGLAGSPAYRSRQLSAVKSLWTFAHRIGYVDRDVGVAVRLETVPLNRGERILPVSRVNELIYGETDARSRVILRVLYVSACRSDELTRLRWRDVQSGDAGEYLRFRGKGDRERYVRIPTALYRDIIALQRDLPGPEECVFDLCNRSIRRVVARAGARCGLGKISPHWLRHAHASHALDHGCPLHVVQATLGHSSLRSTSVYAHARPTDSSALYLEGRT